MSALDGSPASRFSEPDGHASMPSPEGAGGNGAWSIARELAKRVAPKRRIRDAIKRLGYEIRKAPDGGPLEPLELPLVDLLDLVIREHVALQTEPYFVQIGANDGQTEDPMHELVRRYDLRGLLVEPQPRAFQRLVQNYRDRPNLAFENCLLGSSDALATFYVVREDVPDLPFWLHQSASLDRSVVANALRVFRDAKGVSAIPRQHEALIEEVSVPSLTWQSLLRKHAIQKIDVLVIDTMGFDFEIIKLLPFDLIKPHIIHFEHSLLCDRDQRACFQYLAAQGYSLAKVAVDTIACLNARTRRWPIQVW